jgi:hypothetical protein
MKQQILSFIKHFLFYFIILWLLSSLVLGLFESTKALYLKPILTMVFSLSLICIIVDWFFKNR